MNDSPIHPPPANSGTTTTSIVVGSPSSIALSKVRSSSVPAMASMSVRVAKSIAQVDDRIRTLSVASVNSEVPGTVSIKSALFWRILLSSLLVVAVLGIGLAPGQRRPRTARATVRAARPARPQAGRRRRAAAPPDGRSRDRQARILADRRPVFLAPYEQARRDLEGCPGRSQASSRKTEWKTSGSPRSDAWCANGSRT